MESNAKEIGFRCLWFYLLIECIDLDVDEYTTVGITTVDLTD